MTLLCPVGKSHGSPTLNIYEDVMRNMTLVTIADIDDISVGDMVRVIAPTMYNDNLTELIPVGTICRVTETCKVHGEHLVTVKSLDAAYEFCYLANELERGHIEWVPTI